MSKKRTRVALVMPVYNRRETTLQCLKSLARIDDSGLQIKIFVVDDGSTDGTSAAIRTGFPEVALIEGNGELFYTAGINRGITAAMEWHPDFVVAMNDDAVFHEQFLQRLVATAERNPKSAVGALLLLWNEPHKVFQVAPVWESFRGWVFPDLTAFSVPGEAFPVETIVGNCVLLPAAAIRECGLMDEKRFPQLWADAEYLIRMRRAGWKLLIEPRAYVWCEPNTNTQALHSIPMGKVASALFANNKHPMHLKTRFSALWRMAPTKFHAVGAIAGEAVSMAGKAVKYSIKT